MFKKRLITISALPFITALLLGSSHIISNKPEKVSAINDTHEHNDLTFTGVDKLPTTAGNYNIYLNGNITLDETWTVPVGITNLCLNGYVINANGEDFSVITIGDATTLNLYDCGDTSHNGYVDSNGLWHYDSTGTHELLEGETAKTITGGIITGGNPKNGGGVSVGKGEFNMYGGTIAGNKVTSNGGGVSVGKDSSFTISGNSRITNNVAASGGGVYVTTASFKMTGGVITENIATGQYGGGCILTGSPQTLGGSAQIIGNTANGVTNNVLLTNKTITLDNPTTMNVGITLQSGKGKFTVDGTADYSANFFSDNDSYKACFNNNNTENDETDDYLELRTAYAITNNTKEDDKATNHGYIVVDKNAVENEEVVVTVVANEGYQLSSLKYNDGADHDITLTKSFTMQTTAVSITATFEKTTHHHSLSHVDGKTPTCTENGYMEAYYCSLCEQYFEDEACTILIGDETAYNAWKSARGYLPQLPSEGLSAGAIVGICVGSIFLLLLVIYLIGYFFLYRQGKLDEKKIKVIYKFLPRGKKI